MWVFVVVVCCNLLDFVVAICGFLWWWLLRFVGNGVVVLVGCGVGLGGLRGGLRGGFGWLAGSGVIFGGFQWLWVWVFSVDLFYIAPNTQCKIFSEAFS